MPGFWPSQLTPADHSSTITTGGAAQQLMPANANRQHWSFTNQSNDPMIVNDVTTAAPGNGTVVYPGGSVDDGGACTVGAISVYGYTTGDVYSAQDYT